MRVSEPWAAGREEGGDDAVAFTFIGRVNRVLKYVQLYYRVQGLDSLSTFRANRGEKQIILPQCYLRRFIC